MGLRIDDDEVIGLADDLRRRLNLPSRLDAIRYALTAQLDATAAHPGERTKKLLETLREEIWPLLSDHAPITKQERERLLGYGP